MGVCGELGESLAFSFLSTSPAPCFLFAHPWPSPFSSPLLPPSTILLHTTSLDNTTLQAAHAYPFCNLSSACSHARLCVHSCSQTTHNFLVPCAIFPDGSMVVRHVCGARFEAFFCPFVFSCLPFSETRRQAEHFSAIHPAAW